MPEERYSAIVDALDARGRPDAFGEDNFYLEGQAARWAIANCNGFPWRVVSMQTGVVMTHSANVSTTESSDGEG